MCSTWELQSERDRGGLVTKEKEHLKDSAVSWAGYKYLLQCCPRFSSLLRQRLVFYFCSDFLCRRSIERAVRLVVIQTGYYSDSEVKSRKWRPVWRDWGQRDRHHRLITFWFPGNMTTGFPTCPSSSSSSSSSSPWQFMQQEMFPALMWRLCHEFSESKNSFVTFAVFFFESWKHVSLCSLMKTLHPGIRWLLTDSVGSVCLYSLPVDSMSLVQGLVWSCLFFNVIY